MIEILKNKYNLKEREIDKVITRVKVLLINSRQEILLGHSHCEYQFPGGHVEDGENLKLAAQRELKEETGLDYETSKLKLIACLKHYQKDFPVKGKNQEIVIYYYEIVDDRIPNLKNTNYTEEEKDGKYKLRYVPLNIVEDVLKLNIYNCGDGEGIAQEMLELFSYYLAK